MQTYVHKQQRKYLSKGKKYISKAFHLMDICDYLKGSSMIIPT